MNLRKTLIIASCLAIPVGAYAADQPQRSEATQPGSQSGTTVGVTNFAVRPTAGAIFFNGQQRFTGGVLMDFNFLSTPVAKIGPATGALYSSLGGDGSFFGGVTSPNNQYIFQIPANLKVTVAPDPARRLQLGAHGGANIIRSTGALGGAFGGTTASSNLGTTNTGATWDVHPNVGGDIDFALGTNADLTLRPDVTFLSQFNMVTATLGLALKI